MAGAWGVRVSSGLGGFSFISGLTETHHLGGQRFQPPDFSIVSQASMALCLSIRLITG